MKRSLPVAVAVTPDCRLTTQAELEHAVCEIAGAKITEQAGEIMCYSRLTEIDNLDIAMPSGALSSTSRFPGVYVF